MKIEVVWEKFRLQLVADGRSDHTIAQYRRHVGLLARWAAHVGHGREIQDLDHEDILRSWHRPWPAHGPTAA